MLQRAASNACSWWWARHIRTKQSKWLEQSRQDMEEKVQGMLKLIEEDGDSFAKRAEMYYKRRPELINSVEEAHRVFKALADRYDMVSKELQNANHTLGTVFPEQVEFAMENDEDFAQQHVPKKPHYQPMNHGKVPSVPKAPVEKFKGLLKSSSKFQGKQQQTKPKPLSQSKHVVKSGLSKEEALGEIDKVNKEILSLQTVKEFLKSSYETGLAKYWEIENQITQMQEKVTTLQDEFDVEVIIEDNEARSLMTDAALKSCQQTLATLQEKQEKSKVEAKEEMKKIESARELLNSLKRECLKDQVDERDKTVKSREHKDKTTSVQQQKQNENSFDFSSMESLTVSELAEKVDELVNKVVTLETSVSTQAALIDTLRTEADDLCKQIRNLENDKESLKDDSNSLSSRVKAMEEKLERVEGISQNVEIQNNIVQTEFTQATTGLSCLSEKLGSVKPDEDAPDVPSFEDEPVALGHNLQDKNKLKDEKKHQKEKKHHKENKPQKDTESQEKETRSSIFSVFSRDKKTKKKEEAKDVKEKKVDDVKGGSEASVSTEDVKQPTKTPTATVLEKPNECDIEHNGDEADVAETLDNMEEEDTNWKQLLLSGTDEEKALLQEYSTVLKDYKEVKRKLRETEKKERENEFEFTVQIKELKETIAKKDQEIQALSQKLTTPQVNADVKEDSALTSDASEDQSVEPELNNSVGPELNNSVEPELNSSVEPKPKDAELEAKDDGPMEDRDGAAEDDDIPNKSPDDKNERPEITTGNSAVEEKFREEFDTILDENLEFWLRFSTLFNQVQKFKSEVQDLKDEISKLREKKNAEGIVTGQLKSEARPHYKHLREIQTELTLWLEQNATLKDELKGRFSSLCIIQEDITKALKEGIEGEVVEFTSHQAAKLQGEIQNMKHENSKVRKELQAGIDESSILQVEIEKTLKQLSIEFGLASDQPQLQQCLSKARVPLRSFIFGAKPKKKQSIFSFMQAQANRKFPAVRGGIPRGAIPRGALPMAMTR